MAERPTPEKPTPEKFEEQFRKSIRVGFNWHRFLAERWPIDTVMLVSEIDLARCFTPWYVGKRGEDCMVRRATVVVG